MLRKPGGGGGIVDPLRGWPIGSRDVHTRSAAHSGAHRARWNGSRAASSSAADGREKICVYIHLEVYMPP